MADTKISALSAASALGGTEKIPGVQSAANVYLTPAQIATYLQGLASTAELIRDTAGTAITQGNGMRVVVDDAGDTITLSTPVHAGYVSGRWYGQGPLTIGTGAAWSATNLIRFLPLFIFSPVTIQKLGLKVTTLGSSGNAQIAIYARDTSTGLPTGNPLLNTGNLSTNATGTVASAALTNTAFNPGVYWAATSVDNTTAVFAGISNNPLTHLHGSTTLANICSTNPLCLSTTSTFGTWPDMTSVTPTDYTNNFAHAATFFQVA